MQQSVCSRAIVGSQLMLLAEGVDKLTGEDATGLVTAAE